MQVSPSNGKSWRVWVSYKVDPILQSLCSPYFHFVSKAKYLGETMVLPFIVWLPSHFPESFINRIKLDLVEHDHIEAILMLIISIFKWRLSNSTEKKKKLASQSDWSSSRLHWVLESWCQAGGHVPSIAVTVTWSEGVMTPTSFPFHAVYHSVRSALRTYRKKDPYFSIWIKNFQHEQNKTKLQCGFRLNLRRNKTKFT